MIISELLKKHPTFTHAAEMQVITKPLRNIGITYFAHTQIDSTGHMAINSNAPELVEQYILQGFHHHDLHFSHLNNTEQYFLWDCALLTGKTQELYQLASELNYSHTFSIIQFHEKVIHLYHFAAVRGHNQMNMFYLQHIDLLKQYIAYYKECLRINPELNKAYTMPVKTYPQDGGFKFDVYDNALYNVNIPAFLTDLDLKPQIKQIKEAPFSLGKREYQCAYLMLDGLTSKEIGDFLHISPRTVEVYFDRLKQRFNSKNKIQLAKHLMENIFR